jgi:hypothetical protein
MTLQQLAQTIIDDPLYRATLHARAQAGTLPPDVEVMLLEMADGRVPLGVESPPERQSRTLALIPRPELHP